ncbi:retrovirus-related pol polyprotein from transposon TNT 1-94 [Tanacetum coccineum]
MEPLESQQYSVNQSSIPLSTTYPSNNYQSSVHHNVYSPSSSIPQLEYAPSRGDDPIDDINHVMSFFTNVDTSRYPTTNNQLRNSLNRRQQATINDGRVTLQPIQRRQTSFVADAYDSDCDELNTAKVALMANLSYYETEIISDSNIIPYSQYVIESQQAAVQNSNSSTQQDALILSVIEQLKTQTIEVHCDLTPKVSLLLTEESRSKMILKQKDPMMLKKKVNTTPLNYVVLNQLSQDFEKHFVPQTELSNEQAFWSQSSVNSPEPTLSSRPTKVEVPKELPNVSMVNTSLKKLKYHLAGFDVVVKERTTPTAITEGSWGTYLIHSIDELFEVQNVFHQMEQAVEQHRLESKTFECLKLETGLLNKKDFVEKEIYDKLFKSFTTLEKHCISLEVDSQINQEIFQRDISVSNQNAPSFDQLFELNELKAQSQEKDTVIKKLKERIKSLFNLKSVEISDLNASLQEKVLAITALKDDLRKLKGKAPVDNDVTKHPSNPEILKIDVEPITPKLLNKKTAHSAYIKHTQKEATVLMDLVEHVKSKYPLDQSLESACRYAKQIQELLTNISKTCLGINNADGKLMVVTPKNKEKRVRFTEPVTSSGNTNTKTSSSSNLVSNKPMLSSTVVKPSTSTSGSQPSGNIKKNKIRQTPSSTQKNKVESHPRKVKSSLKNKDCAVEPKRTAHVQHSKLNVNSELKYVKCNGCMLSDNHDLCVLDFINNVNARTKSKSVKKNSKRKVWKPTGKCNGCMLSDNHDLCVLDFINNVNARTKSKSVKKNSKRKVWKPTGKVIITTTEVPLRKPTARDNETSKPVITLVYSQKPRKSKTNVPVSKSKVFKSLYANKKEPIQSWGSIVFDVPSSSLDECWSSKLFSEAVATTCYTQNCSIVRLRHGKTPYELLHDKLPDLSFFHVFGALCYLTNDSENLGKLQPKADIDFNELTVMASEHSRSGPALHEMTPAIISSGLVPNPPPSTPFIPPLRIVAPEPAVSTDLPSSTTVDQDAPSPNVAYMNNNPFFGIKIPENDYEASFSDVIPTVVQTAAPNSEHVTKWTKDHPLDNIIGELERPVFTKLQHHEQALFCYYDAFLSLVEPKTYKDALTQSCWIEAMPEELNEFERLEVWELVPYPDKVMVITLKWIYKVKLDELGGILKNKAGLVARCVSSKISELI